MGSGRGGAVQYAGARALVNRRAPLRGRAASCNIRRFRACCTPLMLLTLLKSKIHRATVTSASLHYEGSMTISADLAERVGLLPYERILVGNMANGERFETYVIYGERGAGLIQLNGATAHLGKLGDRVTIMNFGSFTPEEAVGAPPARHRPQRKKRSDARGRRNYLGYAARHRLTSPTCESPTKLS